jgi:hypothetical protein
VREGMAIFRHVNGVVVCGVRSKESALTQADS